MIQILHEVLSFIVAISILVTAHEFGHFWVARRCGVRVLKFSIGFGETLFSWKDRHGTEYIVAAIPLGGYVKMADEREEPVPEEWLPEAFNRKTVWQRIAIVSAGPIANFLLAFVIFWAVNLGTSSGVVARIGSVDKDSIAAVTGLEAGQDIVAVDGRETPTIGEVYNQLVNRLGETGQIHIATRTPGSSIVHESTLDIHDWLKSEPQPDPLAGLGIKLYLPPISSVIGDVLKAGPAARAGLLPGDEIIRIDDVETREWQDVTGYIHAHPGQPLHFVIARGQDQLSFTIIPEQKEQAGQKVGLVGISMKAPAWPDDMKREYHYSVFGAAAKAGHDVINTSVMLALSVKKLLFGQLSIKNVSGPLSIAGLADDAVRGGLGSFVTMLAVLSMSLGVMNLLPIPILDGGHVAYFLVEVITGKPVPLRIQEYGFKIGLFIIISLMMLALYNDFMMRF